MALGIYLPTFGRPHRLAPVAENIAKATRSPYRLCFGVEAHDDATLSELERLGLEYVVNPDTPSFSNALQALYEYTDEPVFFWANDDFLFLDGWDAAPLEMLERFPDIGVLGVHDGNPDTKFWTMSFIRRSYIEEQSGVVDMPDRVLYPYEHNFIDDELTQTAQSRNVWDKCFEPCIIHLHPSFEWVEGRMPTDTTYAKNDKSFARDSALYHSRVHLFS